MRLGLACAMMAAVTLQLCTVFSSAAAEREAPNSSRWGRNADYWEARFGAGAFDFGPATSSNFSGTVINAEILAPSPTFLERIGAPRPYLGADVAISDDAIQIVYGGLSWEVYLTKRLYLGIAGGGSWNSSPQTTNASGHTKDLGSSLLFHLQASFGFDINSWLTMQVFYNHFSNANLGSSNPGLESVGGRLGMRF